MQDIGVNHDSIIIEQIEKVQQPITEEDIGNAQTVRKIIKKYQSKISELLKIINKQKKQNEHLKNQLKILNDSLNGVINKVGFKGNKNHEMTSNQSTLKKQLDNSTKKNASLQKQMLQLRQRVKLIDAVKITDLQDQIAKKDKIIIDLQNELKIHQKVEKRQRYQDVYKREQDLSNKVNQLNDQLLHLKKKLDKSKKQQQLQQKNLKRQHQHIITLQKKSRSTQNLSTFSKTKQPDLSKLNTSFEKLRQNYQSLQSTKKATQRQLRQEIHHLKLKNSMLEKQLDGIRTNIQRKDKEKNILLFKVKENQRKNYRTLEPIDNPIKEQFASSSNIFDKRKQVKGVAKYNGNYQTFDDALDFNVDDNYKIKKITFTWHQDYILSLKVQYQLKNKTIKNVTSFEIPHNLKNIKTGELIFDDYQHIRDMQVYAWKSVEYIKITTTRDQKILIGSERNYLKCKKFVFDIKANEKPIAFMGVVETKKIGENEQDYLTSIGLQIKKKQVFGMSVTSRNKRSKSTFEKPFNDKNIIEEVQT